MSDPLVKNLRLKCSLEHAFETFVDKIDLWWPPSHRKFPISELSIERFKGGDFLEVSDSGQVHKMGEVIHCEPPLTLEYTWYPGSSTEPTLVKITFLEDQEETVIRVEHVEGDSQLGDQWPKRAIIFSERWDDVLTCLKNFI